MANVSLITGGDGRALSRALLDRFRRSKLGAALWIAPTDRIRQQVVTHWALADGVAFRNQVLTFPELARLLAEPLPPERILPDTHQRLLLNDLVTSLRREKALPTYGRLADKPGFQAALFRLMSELRGQGVGAGDFAKALDGLPNRRELGVVYQRFCDLLQTHKWIDRAEVYARAVKRLASGVPACLSRMTALFVDGFSDFTEPQWALLQKLAEHFEALSFGLLDDGRRDELFAVPRKTMERALGIWPTANREVVAQAGEIPAGLGHLKERLFDPDVEPLTDSTGFYLIAAPGELGEARLVARAVKTFICNGARPDDVVVAVRRLDASADLWTDVFDEYGIPFELESPSPIASDPVLIALLNAAALPEGGFAFAPTAALLRSTWLKPAWTEFTEDIGCRAESLLRRLGEPRGKEHFLAATRRWAERVEPPPQDEEADMPARLRTHELAKACEPFLTRFFAAWDAAPGKATLAEHCDWLQGFAKDLGFPAENEAIQALCHELDQWQGREQQQGQSGDYSRGEFLALARSLANSTARSAEQGAGRVRILPAELAAGIDCDHLFLTGLSERSFPAPPPFDPLLDDDDRQKLRAAVRVAVNDDHLTEEMLLFFRLVTSPRRSLTLSRPAVDTQGQEQLPGTFWRTAVALFEKPEITNQTMLIDGLSDPPLCPAEYRVRAGRGLTDELTDHLAAARVMNDQRRVAKFGVFDGLLANTSAKAAIVRRFGPRREFSPSMIERYIACPFQFFLRDVLRLDELSVPDDDVEMSDRGRACHRALSRVHREPELLARLAEALGDAFAAEADVEAMHASSPAVKAIWSLEVERLRRSARTFAKHTEKLLKDWGDKQVTLRPHECEHEFHVTLGEVRLQGRIDRVDVAELADGSAGLVVFDYKSGSSASYTHTRIRSLSLVQLPVYAAAAAEAFNGRPLGMAYWPLDDGPKSFPPRFAWMEKDGWPDLRQQLADWLREIVGRIRDGQFPLAPRDDQTCNRCGYRQTCRISGSLAKKWDLTPKADGEASDD